MAISKIKGGAINDDAISTAKIADDAVTDPKIVDSYTTSVKTNPEFQGTEGARMPVGTTAERANAQSGDIRFNSTISLMEYYDGTNWKSIDSSPVVSSVSPDNFDTAGDTITITGSNFQSGLTVKLIANDGSEFSASTVTYTNSTTASFDVTSAMVADDDDPYDVQVTNVSGLSGTLANALDFAPEPAWTVAAGTLSTIYDGARTSLSITTGATSTESDATIAYTVTTGSLPTGLSIASATGTITGSTSTVGSDTTTTFTLTATATDGDSNVTTNTRQYSIIQKAPVITSYTSVGSGTFSVPTGVTSVDALVVAGGGAGGKFASYGGGGGGAGGLIYRPAFPVTPGGSVSYTVGQKGDGGSGPSATNAQNQGQDSVFGTLTAKGGGGGNTTNGPGQNPFTNGGSGGGGCYIPGAGPTGAPAQQDHGVGNFGNPSANKGGDGTQPQQPSDSGTYGFGNAGGDGDATTGHGSGGGGAGGIGLDYALNSHPQGGGRGDGGIGKQYDISGSQVYYAGGGGGGGYFKTGQGAQGGGGNGGTSAEQGGQGATSSQSGTDNRGGGGGGAAASPGPGTQANGGSGVVIVKY